jgi:DNA-binding response OmpR family regulator
MKLIIIDDDEKITHYLKTALSKNDFTIDIANNGRLGLEKIKNNKYDLIILDLTLPDLSGDQICKTIRSEGQTIPIIILSADNTIDSKINLLNIGADDYLVKPFSLTELIARINALMRRPIKIVSDIIKIDNLEIDKQKQTIKMCGKEIYLTKKEFLILEYLAENQGVVIYRNELMEHVWDIKANFFSKTIEMHLVNLRKKIDLDKKVPLIKTIPGRGYKFN